VVAPFAGFASPSAPARSTRTSGDPFRAMLLGRSGGRRQRTRVSPCVGALNSAVV
jgi:hypothetical protein